MGSWIKKLRPGQSLVELLVGVGLAAILLPAFLTGLIASREGKAQQPQRNLASARVQEGLEAVRSVREASWTNFAANAIGSAFHPVNVSGQWQLVAGAETTSDGLTRSIVLNDVYRDGSGNIASSGTLDPSMKKVTVTASWATPVASEVSTEIYLSRYLDNIGYTDTTQAQFNLGSYANAVSTNTGGGEVTLGSGGGGGDWCNPTLSITTVDLSRQGVPTSIWATPGNVVTGTGSNASGPTFVRTTVAGNAPPVATFQGQYNNSKANAVFADSTYGYIATTDTHQEIKILDLNASTGSPPTYSVVGWFDAPGTGNVSNDTIFAANSVGYMTRDDIFYTFSLGTGSRPQLNTSATLTLSGNGQRVVVVGNYAYVVTDSTTTQLQIINITDPAHPSIVASSSMGNSLTGVDVAVNTTGTRAYVVTTYAAGKQDFFIIDTSSHSGSLSPLGSGFSTAGMTPKGVAVATGNRAIIVGTGGSYQYQVVNIINESSPSICSLNGTSAQLAISGGAFDVASILQPDGFAYSYIVTGDTHAELKMILGGSGGQFVSSGSYVSKTLDAGISTAFNGFVTSVSQPSQTSIKIQVAVANAINGSCSGVSFTYLGPNGDPGQFYLPGSDPSIIEGAIPFATTGTYQNPGRCFSYKIYLDSTDSTAAPVLNDFTVNYSP